MLILAARLTTELALGDAVLDATTLDGIGGELHSDVHYASRTQRMMMIFTGFGVTVFEDESLVVSSKD
jgi:hypothetical protein